MDKFAIADMKVGALNALVKAVGGKDGVGKLLRRTNIVVPRGALLPALCTVTVGTQKIEIVRAFASDIAIISVVLPVSLGHFSRNARECGLRLLTDAQAVFLAALPNCLAEHRIIATRIITQTGKCYAVHRLQHEKVDTSVEAFIESGYYYLFARPVE